MACTTTYNAAPVIERTTADSAASEMANSQAKSAPIDIPEGYYMVQPGDNVYQIALKFGQHSQDIIAWNQLTDPQNIKVSQILRVAPPQDKKTDKTADQVAQTSAVTAAVPDIEVKPLNPDINSGTPLPDIGNQTSPRDDPKVDADSTLAAIKKPAPRPTTTSLMRWPANGQIINAFNNKNKGLDIGGQDGDFILAADAGKVMYAGTGFRGYENLVIIQHTDKLTSVYARNRKILVKEGQIVTKGQKIAEMGHFAGNEGAQLHFEVREQGNPVDPYQYLPPR